jgi:hypothetical protein
MNKKHQIPTPAHPHKRREALPWQQPKATEEDPEALRRVQAILNNPSSVKNSQPKRNILEGQSVS